MKGRRFTEEQIIGVLRGAGGRRKDRRGVPAARDLERDILQVEVEVRRAGGLGRQAAGRALEDGEPPPEATVGRVAAGQRGAQGHPRKKRLKPAARRVAVIRVMERHGLSQRHACELVGLDRSTLRYRCRRPDDSALRQRLKELAAERRRFGYRRLSWMLAREGHALNHKKLYRLYREERLSWCAGAAGVSGLRCADTDDATHQDPTKGGHWTSFPTR